MKVHIDDLPIKEQMMLIHPTTVRLFAEQRRRGVRGDSRGSETCHPHTARRLPAPCSAGHNAGGAELGQRSVGRNLRGVIVGRPGLSAAMVGRRYELERLLAMVPSDDDPSWR